MHLTDGEIATTNSPAFSQLIHDLVPALHASGRLARESCVGIVGELCPLLEACGFSHIRRIPHVVDFSAGTSKHDLYAQDFLLGAMTLEALIVKSGAVDVETYRHCFQQALKDFDSPDFHGVQCFLSAWGVKSPSMFPS